MMGILLLIKTILIISFIIKRKSYFYTRFLIDILTRNEQLINFKQQDNSGSDNCYPPDCLIELVVFLLQSNTISITRTKYQWYSIILMGKYSDIRGKWDTILFFYFRVVSIQLLNFWYPNTSLNTDWYWYYPDIIIANVHIFTYYVLWKVRSDIT